MKKRDYVYWYDKVSCDDFEEMAQSACKRPGMYVGIADYNALTSYFAGINDGRGGAPLLGFHQWLVKKLNEGNNCNWMSNVLQVASKREDKWELETQEDHLAAIEVLGRELAEFFEYRRKVGLTKLFYDHANWLLAKDWYEGPLREMQ